MFRRSRFSIRPNVGSAGRAAATSQEAPAASQEDSETPKDTRESSTATAVTENKPDVTPAEQAAASGDGNDQNGEGTSASAAVQRRKRFSIKPKVAPGRLSTLARMPKSPAKAGSETPAGLSVSDLDKPTTSSQTGPTVSPRGLQSPRRRRPSEDSKQLKVQPKPTAISLDSSGPSAVPLIEDLEAQAPLPADRGKQFESTSNSQVKEVPSRLSDKVPPSLPDKEAIELSEKAKTLVSSKSDLSLSAPAYSLSRLLNDPSDMQRIAKAQKLRELLRQEMHKEKKKKKNKGRAKEFSLDPAKMTMRDLIRYLPESNPMTSSLEETVNENETVIPPSPGREESPERAQEPEAVPKVSTPREEEEEEEEAGPQEDLDEEEEALMVPQVKVAEDGTLIIDEESLTVEVQRTKGRNPAQDRDPIFERGSTTTYSSFRKGTYARPWSSEETDMFFLAISMVGTDFSMICQLFPHRARSEIKNKFKKEERANAWRVDKAFRERRKLDIEYFSKLLEKILEVQKNRKKLKALADKNTPKKQKRKTKGKKATKKLSDVEEETDEGENDMPDLAGEGEKENEALCNEGETPVSKPKRTRKRKNKASKEEPKEKKSKSGEKGNEQDEVCIPEDAEAALPEDHTNPDMSEKNKDVNAAKDAAIKPAKLSRGRAPKPLLPLGRKWGKKLPQPSTKAGEASADKGDKSVTDEASKEQVNKDSSLLKEAKKKKSEDDGDSSEEEESTVPPPRPTRYGRMPKPTKPLTYPAKEDTHSSASESTPASPAAAAAASTVRPKSKPAAKRARSSKAQPAQESKKPKLVTLRASQSDYSDDENDQQWGGDEAEEEQHPAFGNDSIAPAFVPASLRSPHPMISEVEETMEELEILANMPDVLGISQDALCPDAYCEQAQNETGKAEPCEHQLDLLVDVIESLSTEYTEASEDQSYNEAAETLLTIGNLAHLSHPVQNQIVPQEQTAETTSLSVSETTVKPVAQEESSVTALESAASESGVTETVEIQNSITDADDVQTTGHQADSEVDPAPKLQAIPEDSKTDSPQTKKGRLSKVKPKPNLGRASRAAQSKSGPKTSTVGAAEEEPNRCPKPSSSHVGSTAEELHKENDVPSSLEVKPTEEPSDRQERSAAVTLDPESHGLETRDLGTTDDVPDSHVGTIKSSTNDLETPDCGVTDPQTQQVTNTSPTSVEKSSEHPATGDTPVEDLPHSQKEESEDSPASQTRKSRFQRVKPKPNLAQTSRSVRSKPQTTDETSEKDSNLAPSPKVNEKTKEIPVEPTTSPEKPSQSTGPASDSALPSLDLGSALTKSKEVPTAEEKKTATGFVGGQEHSEMVLLDQDDSENENSREQASRVKETKLGSEDGLVSKVGCSKSDSVVTGSQVQQESSMECMLIVPVEVLTTEAGCSNLQKLNFKVIEVQNEQESSKDYTPVVSVGVLSVGQEQESEDESSSKTRRSRFQRVKPNLAQTSRTVRSKPQRAKGAKEEDSNPTPTPNSGKSRESTTEEFFKTELEIKDIWVESGVETCSQSSTENQTYSQALFEPSEEQASMDIRQTSEGHMASHVMESESGWSNLQTLGPIGAEPQVQQESRVVSEPIQETSNQPAPRSTHVEVLPASQEQESEDAPTSQTRRSRFQRVRPNLAQTPRTVRSKPQRTEGTKEEDSNPTPTPNSEKLGEPTTEELFKTELEIKDIWVESGVETCSQSSTENQTYSQALFEPSEEQASMDKRQTSEGHMASHVMESESGWSNLQTLGPVGAEPQVQQGSPVDSEPIRKTSNQPAPCSTHVEVLPASQEQESKDAPPIQTRRSRFQRVNPRTVRYKPRTTRDITNKDMVLTPNPSETKGDIPACTTSPENTCPSAGPPPSLESDSAPPSKDNVSLIEGTISQEKPSQDKSAGPASVSVPSSEFSSAEKPTEELSSAEEPMTDVGPDSSLEGSQQNVPQRRQRFPKVKPKPNVGSSVRGRETKKTQADGPSAPSKQGHMDYAGAERELKPTEQDREDLKKGPLGSAESGSVESGTDSPFTEDLSVLSNSVLQNKSTETTTVEGGSKGDKVSNDQVEAGTSSLWDSGQDPFIEAAETNTKPTEGTTGALRVRSLDTAQQCSETDLPASQSSQEDQSEPTNSSKSPIKAPQSRQGRSMKPKPNLGRRRQPAQTQQAQTIKETQADSDTGSEGGNASVSHKPVSELQPDIQDPLEEALEHCITQSAPLFVGESSFGCASQVTDSSTQDVPMSSAEGTQSLPSLSLFPDMLSGQLPSSPDEPFFTLRLTEIPICPSGEVLEGVAEAHPYTPVTDTSVQQQSDAGVTVAAVGSKPLFKVASPESGEESAEKGPITVEDPEPDSAACVDLIIEDSVEPEGSTAVQPSRTLETVEGKDETEIPPAKRRLQGTTRRGKQQVKPNTSRKKKAGKAVSAKEDKLILVETNTTEESELPRLSVQQRGHEEGVSEQQEKGGNRRSVAEKAVKASKDPEESGSGAQKRQTRGARSRKPPGSLSETNSSAPPSNPPPAKAGRAKTPRAVRRRSTPEAAASTSNVAHTSSTTLPTRTELDTELAFDFPLCSDPPLRASQSSVEVFSSQQSLDASSIEDATSVSQYFLSDIFTDVEEG